MRAFIPPAGRIIGLTVDGHEWTVAYESEEGDEPKGPRIEWVSHVKLGKKWWDLESVLHGDYIDLLNTEFDALCDRERAAALDDHHAEQARAQREYLEGEPS